MSSRSRASMSAADRRGSAATWYRFSSSASAPASWMRRAWRTQPPGAARVQAGDDRDRDGGLDPLEGGQVAVGGARERLDGREVVERLGEDLGALLERAVELDLLGEDLLLEQRRQDDRADAGAFEPPGHRRIRVVRRRRGDDRGAELQPEVAGAQVDGHDPSPSPSYR